MTPQKKPPSEPNNPSDYYVNANFIDSALESGDKKMIAAQGPIEESVSSFW